MLKQNPFHPLSPPDDPTLFFGRQDAIAFLRQRLVGAHNKDILLIIGRVGMGKTALLHQSSYIVDERYQTAYLDLAAMPSHDTKQLIIRMAEVILAMMERIGASTYRIPSTPPLETPEAEFKRWFADDFLDVALTAIRRDRFLLLLIDDLHLLFNAIQSEQLSSGFMTYLGELLAQHPRLDMLAGVDVWHEQQTLAYPVTADFHQRFRLSPFDRHIARQLITESVADQYDYEEEAIQRILDLCGGYPFLLHSVCRLLYRYREQNPNLPTITAPMLEMVYVAALEETGEVLSHFWQHATLEMRITLKALLECQAANNRKPVSLEQLTEWLASQRADLNQTKLVSKLRQLEYDALVQTTTEGDYCFRTGLEADWLAAREAETPIEFRTTGTSWTAIAGIVAVLMVVCLVGAVLGFGLLGNTDDATPDPDNNNLPTVTYEIDLDATRQATQQTATARAIPSATITPSPTEAEAVPSPTITSTETEGDTDTEAETEDDTETEDDAVPFNIPSTDTSGESD